MLDAARMEQEAGPSAWPTFPRRCISVRAGTPVTSAVRASVHCLQYAATASNPTVCASMNARSIQPRSIMMCSMPAKSAASRPGLTGRYRSQVRAIGVMRGSWMMIRRALLARLPEVVGGDRRALGDVRARHPDHAGADHVGPGIGGAVDAEGLLVRRAGGDHAQPAVVVDVAASSGRRARTCRADRTSRWSGTRRRARRSRPARARLAAAQSRRPRARSPRPSTASAEAAPARTDRAAAAVSRRSGCEPCRYRFTPFGQSMPRLNGNSSHGSKPITSLSRTLSWMPHCWPQKQQCVLTRRSGSTLVDSRTPVIADRCGPKRSVICRSSTGIVATALLVRRPNSARRQRGHTCW